MIQIPRWLHFMLILLCGGPAATAAQAAEGRFTTLKTFSLSGALPKETLLLGRDGFLYGTTYRGGALGSGTVFRMARDGANLTVLHSFGENNDGLFPAGQLVQGSDGVLYGVTSDGGGVSRGTVFKLRVDGSDYTVLRSFGVGDDGRTPVAGVTLGRDGFLYGTTIGGGRGGGGTAYRISTDGQTYQVMYHFSTAEGGGSGPASPLLQASDGRFYGTAGAFDIGNGGMIYRLDGFAVTVVKRFTAAGSDGYSPNSPLVEGDDGYLYGITEGRPFTQFPSPLPAIAGNVFKVRTDGTGFTVLRTLPVTVYEPLRSSHLMVAKGVLHGTFLTTGGTTRETLFRMNLDGSGFAEVRVFTDAAGYIEKLASGLVDGDDGFFYGVTVSEGTYGQGGVFRLKSDGSSYARLAEFGGDGARPLGGLLLGGDGFLYGTTVLGGTHSKGSVFKMRADGTGFVTLRSFTGDSDGALPASALVLGSDGFLHGTTGSGGSGGYGTIFKLRPDGSGYAITKFFSRNTIDVIYPEGGLVAGTDGFLYGVTRETASSQAGAVYRIRMDGTAFSVLKSFSGLNGDGATPRAPLVLGTDGFLYGTTRTGGNGGGTIFRLRTNGSDYAVIRTFLGGPADGMAPAAGLSPGSDGVWYGTTEMGGRNSLGTVFRIGSDGSNYKVLHDFGAPVDGHTPQARPVLGTDGYLYGTTSVGGAPNFGTIFRIHPDGTGYETLKAFAGATDGAPPHSGLTWDGGSVFYGTSATSGPVSGGTIFSFTLASTRSATGQLANGEGQFAAYLHPDGTGAFLAFLPARGLGLVATFTAKADGSFEAVTTQYGPGASDGPRIRGRFLSGTVEGTIETLNVGFSASLARPVAGFSVGLYSADALGTSAGRLHVLATADGAALALLATPAAVEGGSGSMQATGGFSATTNRATQVSGTVAAAGTVDGTWIRAGNPVVRFAGLSRAVVPVRQLANLSARALVGRGDEVLIVGFVVEGTADKQLLFRAAGPALVGFGVVGTLAAPRLQLFEGDILRHVNIGWGNAANATQIAQAAVGAGAFAFAPGSADSAAVLALAPGRYTAVVSGSDGGTGVSLVELYDIGGATARLANISTRVAVGQGSQSLIGGMVVAGNAPKRVLIRAVGPTLTGFGVTNSLADPQFQLQLGPTLLAQNSGWADNAEIAAASTQVGAFALRPGSRDAALIVMLNPGAYSVLVSSTSGTPGVALLETYELPVAP